MIHLGFTGTREGMTAEQIAAVTSLVRSMLRTYGELVAHHGDCIGADSDFHHICRSNGVPIHLHPPSNDAMRASCDFDIISNPLPYLVRNQAIVDAADRMIACPAEPAEKSRGGTWATVRMARRAKKKIAIVQPDGKIRIEEPKP